MSAKTDSTDIVFASGSRIWLFGRPKNLGIFGTRYGHFEGSATGETFNYEGKTDTLIRERGVISSLQNLNTGTDLRR